MANISKGLLLVSIILQIVMLTVVSSNKIVSRNIKNRFIIIFILLFIITICECLSVDFNYNYVFLQFLMYSIAPIIAIIVGNCFGIFKKRKFVILIVLINVVVQLLPFTSLFYISRENITNLNNVYFFYEISFIVSLIFMFKRIYSFSFEYQSKKQKLILSLFTLLILIHSIQTLNPKLFFYWSLATLVCLLLYLYYCNSITTLDKATLLLNSNFFEKKSNKLKYDSSVIIFDVNKYNNVIDIYDIVSLENTLKEIGAVILDNFGEYGYCFRIDDYKFCVVLEKRLDLTNSLIKEFQNKISLEQEKVSFIPKIAIGYGFYYKDKNNIKAAISRAERMLDKNYKKNNKK